MTQPYMIFCKLGAPEEDSTRQRGGQSDHICGGNFFDVNVELIAAHRISLCLAMIDVELKQGFKIHFRTGGQIVNSDAVDARTQTATV